LRGEVHGRSPGLGRDCSGGWPPCLVDRDRDNLGMDFSTAGDDGSR
jgi:hypothetical protein